MTHRLSKNIRHHLITYPLIAFLISAAILHFGKSPVETRDIYLTIIFVGGPYVFSILIESQSKTIFFDDYNFYIHSPFREKHLGTHHLKTVTDVMSWFFVIVVKFKDGYVERKVFCFPGGPQSFKELLNPRGFFEDDDMEELFNEHVDRVKGRR